MSRHNRKKTIYWFSLINTQRLGISSFVSSQKVGHLFADQRNLTLSSQCRETCVHV